MSVVDLLEKHRQAVVTRTVVSIICYLGFLVGSTISAAQQLALESPVTLVTLVLVVAAFIALPRDYVPAVLARKAMGRDEAEFKIGQLRQFQQWGIYLRVAYAIGAIITLLLLPRITA